MDYNSKSENEVENDNENVFNEDTENLLKNSMVEKEDFLTESNEFVFDLKDKHDEINVNKVWQIRPRQDVSKKLWNHFRENNYISIGFSDINLNTDLSTFNSFEDIFDNVKSSLNDDNIKEECSLIFDFINKINIGDIVVVTPGNKIVYGIGVVESDYIPPKKSNITFCGNYTHSRQIKWIYTNKVQVDKITFSSKYFDEINNTKWNRIILKYMDYPLKVNLFNKLVSSYRNEWKYHDKDSFNFYQKYADMFNHRLNEIINDLNKDIVDIDRIFDEIIAPKDLLFSEPVYNLKNYLIKNSNFNYTEEKVKSIAIKYIELLKLFKTESNEEILKSALKEFDKEYGKGIGLSRVSASLMYLNTDKYCVINSITKDSLELIPRFLDYDISINDSIGDYLDYNKKLLDFINYLIENNSFISNEDFDQFGFWLREHNFINKYLRLITNSEVDISQYSNLKRNLIYFGAPGTGKSFVLNECKDKYFSNENNYTRVTFHPDYSYANFVGVYKPVPSINEDGKKTISYEYVPGPFMRTLVKALDKPKENYLLIIEEINRANVAAVFGDIFQLLDRKKDNSSRYPIDTSIDMKKYLEDELGKSYDKIKIPSNMYIWATMNSADQGVFPMDTAFKRRWNFKYFGIDEGKEEMDNVKFTVNDVEISWNALREEINNELLGVEYKINEDKLLGPFFAFDEYKDTEITEEDEEDIKDIFKNKVIMYLFEDAVRSKRNELFSGVSSDRNLTYSQVCAAFDEIGVGIFCENIRSKFINEDGE